MFCKGIGLAIAFKTSPFIILPSLPVPETFVILFSSINFSADGAFLTPLFSSKEGAFTFCSTGVFLVSALDVAPSEICARRASTPTVTPSPATISESVPLTGAATSTVTLSVSNSHIISS